MSALRKQLSALILPLIVMQATAVIAKPQYGYKGDVSPEKWGQLSPAYQKCSDGAEQAPVNIVTSNVQQISLPVSLKPDYPAASGVVVNTGTTIQVNTSGGLKIGNQAYKLLQYHFHTPSEEAINGVHFKMNVHLVHQNAAGKLAVIGVNFKEGAKNTYLDSFWSKLPRTKGAKVDLNLPSLSGILPANLGYFTYAGSLTTPPCSEGVQFYILKDPVSISVEQLSTFQKLYPMNARPLQPLNERVIKSSN